jgi:hypothetical protein
MIEQEIKQTAYGRGDDQKRADAGAGVLLRHFIGK